MIIQYHTRSRQIIWQSFDCQIIESSKGLCLYCGDLKEETDVTLQTILISDKFEDCSDCFLGPYIAIVYNKERKTVFVRQHYFGGPVNLYYATYRNSIFLSTSIAKLKAKLRIDYKLNIDMLPHFFYNGFLPGTHTLVKGIHKFPPGYYAEIDSSGIRIERDQYRFETNLSLTDEEWYRISISESIGQMVQLNSGVHDLALSGGYDSNCLLYFLRYLYPQDSIRAFSVGGVSGVNETAIAQTIASTYPSVQFFSALVTLETANAIDEIVRRLEGSVYERGIFLQYELSRLIHMHSGHRLICGECADQVFHAKAYQQAQEGTFLFDYLHTPYEMAANVVLKKSALMLRSFGITGAYPFLDMNVLRLGYRTRARNGIDKHFHKEQCQKYLPDYVCASLSKVGGSTSLCALVDPSFDAISAAKKLRYYSDAFRITEKYERREAELDYFFSLKYLLSFERQFCD